MESKNALPDILIVKRLRLFLLTSLSVVFLLAACSTSTPAAEPTAAPDDVATERTESEVTPTAQNVPTMTAEVTDVDESASDAASIAVEAAQQYAGTTLRVTYEAGLQALDGYFFGEKWTELTGINVEIEEVGFEEMFDTISNNAGQSDIFNVTPSWQGDLVAAGLLEPLDDYIAEYYPEKELADIYPAYRDWMAQEDHIYLIPDDGDVHILYYRRDLFEEPDNQAEFEAQYNYALHPPESWPQWNDICAFFTEKYAPEIYGCSLQHTTQSYHWFESIFRSQGGEFFDPETMKAQVNNEIGGQSMNIWLASLNDQPPGVKDWGFLDNFGSWIDGRIAMTISWPPIGRWSEGYGSEVEQLNWLPETQIAGKVGYAIQPEGGELAVGFGLAVSGESSNKEAAYLFMQWMSSKEISLQRTVAPFALRDPYRESHYESELYREQWEAAPQYLDTLRQGADTGYLDLSIPAAREYETALDKAMIAVVQGDDIQETLDQLAAEWDAITEQNGIEAQKEAYLIWRQLPNSYHNK